jgi:GT2 family glycosyltransferase
LVGGEVANALIRNLYSEASQFVTEHLYEYYANNETGLRFFTTNNMACLAAEFHGLGGFAAAEFPSASEDRDFCDRWQSAGKKLIYEPKARVFHSHDLNMRAFWRQHMNYGTGGHAFHSKRRKTRQLEIRVEKLNFYSRLLSRPFRKERPNALSISALIILSQIANAVGFFQAFQLKSVSRKVADFDTLQVRLGQEA